MTTPAKIGRYEILEELGQGAMGAVYKARDPLMDRTVAVKTILAAALAGPLADEYLERFQREARAAGRLSHPGIVTVFDVGQHDTTPYLVMEYISGRTLASALEAGERFDFGRICEIGQQIAEALGYAHQNGVIHRDIKPANILLAVPPSGGPERAKITDFGVAKLSAAQVTVTGQLLGTPSFMPPESFTGAPIDGRSDLFSLGVMLYWMATGDKPFVGDTLTAVSYKVVHSVTIPPRKLNPAVPAALERIILRCLEKDPARRFQTGQELAAALAEVRKGGAGATIMAAPDALVPEQLGDSDATLDAHALPKTQISRPSTRVAPPPPPPPAVEPKRGTGSRWVLYTLLALICFLLYRNLNRPQAPMQLPTEVQKAAPLTSQPPEAKASPDSAAKKTGQHPESVASKTAPPPIPAPPAPTIESEFFPPPSGSTSVPRMSREEFEKKFAEQIRKDVERYRQQAESLSTVRKSLEASRRAQRPALEPVPADRARLLIDTSRIPTGLGLVVMLDGQQIFRGTDRRGTAESHWYHQLISPGTHELRAIVGAGSVRLGASNLVAGEFVAGQERTLRIELGLERRARPSAKEGERQSPALEVRVTLD